MIKYYKIWVGMVKLDVTYVVRYSPQSFVKDISQSIIYKIRNDQCMRQSANKNY